MSSSQTIHSDKINSSKDNFESIKEIPSLTIEAFRNQFVQGDALEVMRQMPDKSFDLVVTSPPYNLKNSTGNGMKDGRGGKWANAALVNGYSHHDDNMPHDE